MNRERKTMFDDLVKLVSQSIAPVLEPGQTFPGVKIAPVLLF